MTYSSPSSPPSRRALGVVVLIAMLTFVACMPARPSPSVPLESVITAPPATEQSESVTSAAEEACPPEEPIAPPCEDAGGSLAAQVVAALDAAGIEHERCLRLSVDDSEGGLDFTGYCARPPELARTPYGQTLRFPLHRAGDDMPSESALVLSVEADDLAREFGRPIWVEGANPSDARHAARILARVRAALEATPPAFESIERGQLFLRRFYEGNPFIDAGGRTLVIDLGAESLLCVSREAAHLACVVLALPDLRIERAKPREVRLDLEEGDDVDARLFVSFGGDSHALRLQISASAAPKVTTQRVLGGFPQDGHPWWWPARREARLERARAVVTRAPSASELALATDFHALFGNALVDVSGFDDGDVYLLSVGGGGDLDFHRSVGGLVTHRGEPARYIELTSSSHLDREVILTAPRSVRGHAGALELGFFLTISAQLNLDGDVRRFEAFATLRSVEGHHYELGPGIELGVERDEPVRDDLVLWRGWARPARWCGDACLALGQARAYVGEYRAPDFRHVRGMRPRTPRDDAEDEAVFADPDAEPPSAEQQREMEAERARHQEDWRPREVDLGALRGGSGFPF